MKNNLWSKGGRDFHLITENCIVFYANLINNKNYNSDTMQTSMSTCTTDLLSITIKNIECIHLSYTRYKFILYFFYGCFFFYQEC